MEIILDILDIYMYYKNINPLKCWTKNYNKFLQDKSLNAFVSLLFLILLSFHLSLLFKNIKIKVIGNVWVFLSFPFKNN